MSLRNYAKNLHYIMFIMSAMYLKEKTLVRLVECTRDINRPLHSLNLSSGCQTRFQPEVDTEGQLNCFVLDWSGKLLEKKFY